MGLTLDDLTGLDSDTAGTIGDGEPNVTAPTGPDEGINADTPTTSTGDDGPSTNPPDNGGYTNPPRIGDTGAGRDVGVTGGGSSSNDPVSGGSGLTLEDLTGFDRGTAGTLPDDTTDDPAANGGGVGIDDVRDIVSGLTLEDLTGFDADTAAPVPTPPDTPSRGGRIVTAAVVGLAFVFLGQIIADGANP
jgi:hypothetical protein